MNTLPPISHPDSQVHALDRLAFTLLMAVVIHFLVWAALDIQLPQPKVKTETNSTLRVTLVKVKAQTVDEPVQHIAEHNQAASGVGVQDLEPQQLQQQSSPPAAQVASKPEPAKPTQPTSVKAVAAKPEPTKAEHKTEVQTDRAKQDSPKVAKVEPKPQATPKPTDQQTPAAEPTEALPQIDAQALLARSLEIARLEAEQQALAEQYAKRPKVRTLSTVSAKAYDDAAYLRQWQEQIERVGNLNYPERVRAEKLSGRLRMLVALHADGSIKEIQLLKSSGFELLDQSAINIVKLAAPFAAFPRSIKERTDILEIIRTWQFGDGNLFGEAG